MVKRISITGEGVLVSRDDVSLPHRRPKRTLGVKKFVRVVTSRNVPKEVFNQRIRLCRTCTIKDEVGERLFREVNHVLYCGKPKLKKLLRDERQSGCGCFLIRKLKKSLASCPHRRWSSYGKDVNSREGSIE